MSATNERLSIVETKVENLNEKIDEIKVDIKDLHDCVDRTRSSLTEKLDTMYDASCSQHKALAEEINKIKKERDRVIWFVGGGIAFVTWISGHFNKIADIIKSFA